MVEKQETMNNFQINDKINLEDLSLESTAKEVRVAVIGNVDSGKSTLVGVLTKCALDDGRGLLRKLVFNYSHEKENGRTSSITQEIMGFKMVSRSNLNVRLKKNSLLGQA
jgi:GTPase